MHTLAEIPTQEYLQDALSLTPHETELRNSLMRWLPAEIIDSHVHANLAQHVTWLDEGVFHHMMSTFPAWDLNQSAILKMLLYPGKVVRSIYFANAYRGIDHRQANDYLISRQSTEVNVALYGIPDDIPYTLQMLRSGVCGLKMYYQYFSPPAQTIFQVFPARVLAECQRLNIPIILHLPKMVTKCVQDLDDVLRKFPKLMVVLAHMGLPHLPVPGLKQVYEHFAQFANVFMDTAMIPNADVIWLGLQAFGAGRIIYGSDEPLSLIRSRVYNHPTKGQRLITSYPYHWVDHEEHQEFQHLAGNLVQTHWQVLQAIREAVTSLPEYAQQSAIQAIFYGNASRVFNLG